MIEIKQLTKKYNTLTALDKITFNVESGSIVGFLGPNGAGKTTAMRILAGYMPPTSGEVTIEGRNVNEKAIEVKKLIGYLPEDNPLYGDLNPLEYLEFCGKIRNMSEDRIIKRINEVVDICGLEGVSVQPISTLSKGYRQRVGLAQAILHDPPILLLDEPTSGLDPNQIREIRNLIQELQEKKTIILSTHIMQEVQATCKRVLIINKGRIVADGTHEELTSTSGKTIFKVKLDGPDEEVLQKLEGLKSVGTVRRDEFGFAVESEHDKDPRRDIFELAKQKDWTILNLETSRQSLEEVFRKLTTEEK
ncbi:MAG: ATP-binding cassette domain-containing protein [Elusimicrobiota bacterium]